MGRIKNRLKRFSRRAQTQLGWNRSRSTKARASKALQLEALEPRVLLNATAAVMSGIDVLQNLGLTGAGITIHEWDGGQIWVPHVDFIADGTGHVTVADEGALLFSSHATHVAGTMIGQGQNPAGGGVLAGAAGGMAPGAMIVNYRYDGWVGEQLAAAQGGAIISNNSWGNIIGWSAKSVDGVLKWTWWGDPNVNADEDYRFGWYGAPARALDIITYQNPYYTSVRSAGNDASDRGPAVGTEYYEGMTGETKTYDGVHPTPDGILHATDGAGNTSFAYDTIGSPAGSKNSITVGAIRDSWLAPVGVNTTVFSGRGPTDDGRIKPDIVANGSVVYSTDFAKAAIGPPIVDSWSFKSGTSMATPVVSGGIALLQEHYFTLHNAYMRSDTVKALLIHTAQDEGVAPGPNYATGWGLFNAEDAYNMIQADNDATDSLDDIQTLTYTGKNIKIPFYSSGVDPVKVTIAWTDPPGDVADDVLNDRTPRLKNDLDLVVWSGRDGSGTAIANQSWTLDPNNPTAAATQSGNHVDNVEQVYIKTPTAGWYTVYINDMSMATATQDFTLIVEGMEDRPELHATAMSVNQPYLNRGQQPANPNAQGWLKSTFQIANTGSMATEGPFQVKFYLSQDQNIDPNTDMPLDILVPDAGNPLGYSPASSGNNYIHTDPLGINQIINVTVLLDPPDNDPFNPEGGSVVYVGMVIDPDDTVIESDETNNLNRGLDIDVAQNKYWPNPQGVLSISPNDLSNRYQGSDTTNQWDLHMEVVRGGQEMIVELRISDKPHGRSQSFYWEQWATNIFFGDSSAWPGVIDINEEIAAKPLEDGGFGFTLPHDDFLATDMEYYLGAYVQYKDNNSLSGYFEIGDPVPVHWAPDVYFVSGTSNSLTSNVPKDMQFGYPLYDVSAFSIEQAGVEWSIRSDLADVPAGTPINFSAYLQDPKEGLSQFDTFFGLELFPLGTSTYIGGIDRDDATQNPTGTFLLNTLPESDPFGTARWDDILGVIPYYINTYIDRIEIPTLDITESNVSNNQMHHAVAYYPDLVGVAFDAQISSEGGSSPYIPDQATVNFSVQSKYGVAFEGWDIDFYLSGDDTIDPNADTLLGTYRVERRLGPDEVFSDTIVLPIDEQWMSAWHDYTIGMVIDYKSDTNYPEHDDADPDPRANNSNVGLRKDKSTIYLSRVADFKWVQASVATDRLEWGDEVAINVEVQNAGPTSADPVEATVYIWSDPFEKFELGSFAIAALSAETSTGARQYSFTLPNKPIPFIDVSQDVYFDIYIDEDNAVAEANENNNSAWSLGTAMTVSFGTTGSLVVLEHTIEIAQANNVREIDVTFNKPINAATFTKADVTVTGPGGNVSISGISHVADNTYRITLNSAQSAGGTYTIAVGPNISDSEANPMNQDGDTVAGEPQDDQYLSSFVVIQPPPSFAVTGDEQLFIYLLNRARSNPQAYEDEAKLPDGMLAGVAAQPPLAVNDLLHNSARFHAEEMADNDYFGHTSQVTGDTPNQMAIDAGYNLPFSAPGNSIESIAAGWGNSGDPEKPAPETADANLKLLVIDKGVDPPGHRQHLLAMLSGYELHREVGVGFASNSSSSARNYWAIHTAYVNTSDMFLTGVVYDDKNSNDRYDRNEGLSGVTVSTNVGGSVLTNGAGGWSLAVTAGTYIVSASGGSHSGISSSTVIVDDSNVEIDFTSGDAGGVVDFGQDTGSGLPEVSIVATDAAAAEAGPDTGTFTLTRTGDTTEAMTVNYNVAGTATAGSDYNALSGSAVIPAGQSFTVITVTPIDDSDIEGQETVVVTVLAGLEYQLGDTTSDTVVIADDEGAIVTLVNGSVSYTEPDGTVGTVTAKSANATIVFLGDNLVVQTGKKTLVTGVTGATITDITLDGTSTKTSLTFKAKGGADGLLDIDNIVVNGSAKSIKGKQVDLGGDLTVTGGLASLELHNVAGDHTFNIGIPGPATGSLKLKLFDVSDLSINSSIPLKSVTVNSWQDTNLIADTITAPSLGKLTVKQDFAAGLTLTDGSVKKTLGAVKVTGAITGGIWFVSGNAGKITANSIADDWSAEFIGDLAGLSTKGNAGGNLKARSVKSITIKGDYSNSNLTLTQLSSDPKEKALGKLTVKGTMNNVNLRSQGNIGSVTVGLLADSNIFAGIDDLITALPTSASDFDTDVTIAKFKLKGSKTENIWMQNSNIAASNVTSVSFGFAQTDNNGTLFGIATKQFKSISYVDANGKIKASKLDDLVKFNNLDDLLIRIF